MKTIELNCSRCSKKFFKTLYEYNRRLNKGFSKFFCSNSCNAKNAREGFIKNSMERRNSFSKNCLHCHSRISFKQKINKFCSSKCAATFNQKEGGHRKWTDEDKNKQSYLLKNKPIPSNRKIYDTVIRKCPICSSDFSIKEYSKKSDVIVKSEDTNYIKNPLSGKWVKKDGVIGKILSKCKVYTS